MKNVTKILIALGTLVLLGVLGYFYFNFALNRPNQTAQEPKTITIETGMGSSAIARLLADEKLINSYYLFVIYSRVYEPSLQAGVYTVPSNLNVKEVAALLTHGVNDTKLTFLEGWRAEEFAELAASELPDFDYDSFITNVKEETSEGYLFPDTYFLDKNTTSAELFKILLVNYDTKTKDLFANNKTGLTEREVLILASIVEREESNPEERPAVAGILLKRFQNGELIGADATTQYIFGTKGNWWPKDLTQDQLDSSSPYNTRKVVGLPPAPISNPGLSSISAVINHSQTPYNYYLHDKDGNIHYAITMEDHLQNIGKYLY